jgi:uncharacterized protein
MTKNDFRHALQAICLAGSLLLSATPAVPQTATPEATAAARDLVKAMRADEQMKVILPNLLLSMKSSLSRGNPAIERDYDAVLPVLMDMMNARMRDFTDMQATVYAQNFSPEELKQLADFYRSPIGQKLVDRMPAIAKQSLMAGQAFGQQIGSELQSRLIQELRKKGHNI